MAKKTKKETEEIQKDSTIYIGKPLQGLPQYTIFKHGVLPPHVKEIAKGNDSVLGLIVPVKDLQEARKNMLTKGHLLNYHYETQKQGDK